MELPAAEILVKVQRICRQWRAVFDWSTAIQQVLFFKPVSGRLHYPSLMVHTAAGAYVRYFDDQECAGANTTEGIKPIENPAYHFAEKFRGSEDTEAPLPSWTGQLLTQPPLAFCNIVPGAAPHYRIDGESLGVMLPQLVYLPQHGTLQGIWRWRDNDQWNWREEPARRSLWRMKHAEDTSEDDHRVIYCDDEHENEEEGIEDDDGVSSP